MFTKKRTRLIVFALVISLLAASCSPVDNGATNKTTTPDTEPSSTTEPLEMCIRDRDVPRARYFHTSFPVIIVRFSFTILRSL